MRRHPLFSPLRMAGGIVLSLCVVAALLVALASEGLSQPMARIVPALLLLAAGLTFGGLLLAMSYLLPGESQETASVRLLEQIRDQLVRAGSDFAQGSPGASAGVGEGAQSARVVQLLDEIRDISLMNEQQRQEKRARLNGARARSLAAGVESLIQQQRWVDAQNMVRQGLDLFGGDAALAEVERKLGDARMEAHERAITELRYKVDNLKGMNEWDQAVAESEAFLQTFPDSAPGVEFHAGLLNARELHTDALANQLYEEIRLASEQRRWRVALAAAQRLMAKCPQHLRAQQVMTRLDLIRENADVEQRNAMEAKINEHVRADRVQDAIEVAQELIQAYPLSPQAQIASQLVERLRQRQASEAAAT